MNLHKAFGTEKGYLANLRVVDGDAVILRSARELARQAIRDAFAGWQSFIERATLFEDATLRKNAGESLPAPKFRMQGSWSYHTANNFQQNPPQQVDMDDGVFMPVGFLASHGEMRPGVVAEAYFKLVEKALAPLCARKRWRLNTSKTSCVRIEINERVHLDIALYAIEDKEFTMLVEARAAKVAKGAMGRFLSGDNDLPDDVYQGVVSDIMLANRDKGWIPSDPRKLDAWWNEALDNFGDQARRLTRSFKGMRDWKWKYGDLSSICIMAGLVQALRDLDALDRDRDDIGLSKTARRMAVIFKSTVKNPVLDGGEDTHLCNGWSREFRQEVCGTFERIADTLDDAMDNTYDRNVVLSKAASVFGDRMPNDPDLVVKMSAPAYPRSKQAEIVPAPIPLRTKSG
jgi:hypothetical protein